MINRNEDKNNEVLLKIRHLIDLAISQQQSIHLKEAIDAIDQELEDSPLVERIKQELLFECFVISISQFGLYDSAEEQAAWKRHHHSDLILTWETGLDYIVDRFLKRLYNAKQYTALIGTHEAIKISFDFLNCNALKKQRETLELFYKKITIYKNLALSASKIGHTSSQEEQLNTKTELTERGMANKKEWHSLRIDIANLDGLNNMTPEALQKIQLVNMVMLDKSLNESANNRNIFHSSLFSITTFIASSVICYLHEQLEDGLIHSEYKRYLCSTYKSSVLHQLRKKGSSTVLKQNDYYKLATKNFISIFLHAFPMIGANETQHIITLIRNGISNANKINQDNPILQKVCNSILYEFDNFKLSHDQFYPYFVKVNDRYGETDIGVTEMKEINLELTRLVQKIIPKQCMNILSYFHDKIAITNLLLLNDDKTNCKIYKKNAIESFRNAQNCWPARTLNINVLYCADIPLYAIDSELMGIVRDLKKSIKLIKGKSSKINIDKLNISIFDNIQRYLAQVTSYQTRVMQPIINYNELLPLSSNLTELIKSHLSQLMRNNNLSTISCCQALEQLNEECELESNMEVAHQFISPIIMSAKLQTIASVIKESKLENNSEYGLDNAIRNFGKQYLSAAMLLKKHHSDEIVDHTLITDIIIHLVDFNEKQANLEASNEYLTIGNTLSPNNASLIKLMISVEQDRMTGYIEKTYNDKLKTDSIISTLVEIDQSIAALNQAKQTNFSNKIDSFKQDYDKIATAYASLVKQFQRIHQQRESLNKANEKYNFIVEQLDQAIIHSDSESRTNEVTLLYQRLDKLHAIKESIKEEEKLRNVYLRTSQSLIACIKQYEANMKLYQLMTELLTTKINEHNAKSALKTAILDIKRTNIKLKNEKKNQEILLAEYHVARKKEVEINLQIAKLRKIEKQAQEQVDNCLSKEQAVNHTLEMAVSQFEKIRTEGNYDLLNGSGIPVSPSALNRLKMLDLSLRKIGTNIIFKSSLTTRFCIRLFNENPEIAQHFPINDVDIFIPYQSNIDIGEVIRTIEQFEFHQNLNTVTHNTRPYRQFSNEIDGTKIDITLATHISYCSFEFIILRMGQMKFAYFDNEKDYEAAIASGSILMPADKHVFEIILPSGYEDKFISACRFDEFIILQPDNLYKSYCYSIYKYSAKLYVCGALDKAISNHQTSLGHVHYHALYSHLVNHFEQQLKLPYSTVYLEINEFVKKGIDTRIKHLATPFISAFFYALIKYKTSQLNGLNVELELDVLTGHCADIFIHKHIIYHESAQIELYDLISAINTIAEDAIQNNYLSSNHAFFLNDSKVYTGTLFNNRANHAETQRHSSNKRQEVEVYSSNQVITQSK